MKTIQLLTQLFNYSTDILNRYDHRKKIVNSAVGDYLIIDGEDR